MSLLGFDAIGRLALGQMRVSGSNVLFGGTGSYVVVRIGANFGIGEPAGPAGYAIAANAVVFSPGLNVGAGRYSMGGAVGQFFTGAASNGTSYVLTGSSVKTAMVFGTVAGKYIVAYGNVAGAVALNAGTVGYQVTGGAAALGRDYVNWWPIRPVAKDWAGEATPSPAWVVSAAISPAWSADIPAVSVWTPRTATPSAWTADPGQAEPDPVQH